MRVSSSLAIMLYVRYTFSKCQLQDVEIRYDKLLFETILILSNNGRGVGGYFSHYLGAKLKVEQLAKFGQGHSFLHNLIAVINNKLTRQTVKILMRRL